MTVKLLIVGMGAAAADAAASGPRWGVILQQAAATVTALTVIIGAVWWLIGPRIRAYLRAQTTAAAQVDQVATTLPAARDSLGERIGAVEDELNALHTQLHDHLLMAQGETRLVSELLLRASEDHDHHHR